MKHELANATIQYEEVGAGRPIVILHAMGTDHRAMFSWMEDVFSQRHGWNRIYVDLPGHGGSTMFPYVTTSDEMLSLLLNFLNDKLGHNEFAMVGMSFGGYMAQGILQSLRDRVTGVCLVAPAMHARERKLPPKSTFDVDESLLATLEPDIRMAFETLMATQTQDTFERFLEEIQPGRILADRTFLTSCWRKNGYYFSSDPLEGEDFLQPTLFVLGRQDYICGYENHFELLKKFPNATYAVLDHSGHVIPFDQRYVLQTLVSEWLDRVAKNLDKN